MNVETVAEAVIDLHNECGNHWLCKHCKYKKICKTLDLFHPHEWKYTKKLLKYIERKENGR